MLWRGTLFIGGHAHVGEEIRRPIASGISKLVRDNLQYEPEGNIALKTMPEKPSPTLPGIQTIIDELAPKNPKAKNARPEDFVDTSFVKKLEDDGFFARLYKR